MTKLLFRIKLWLAAMLREDRDGHDLGGPMVDALISDLAYLDNFTRAVAAHRR